MIHQILLTGYTANLPSGDNKLKLGTKDSYGNEQLQLNLCPEWQNLTLTATFYAPGVGKGTRVLADTNGLVVVPPEATATASTVYHGRIVFAGTASGVRRISVTLLYDVADHMRVEGEESAATPSVLDQAITQTDTARNEAVSAAAKATQSAAQAVASAEVAKKSKVAAEASIREMEKSAVTAIKTSYIDTEQAIKSTKATILDEIFIAQNETIEAIAEEGAAQADQLKALLSNIYTKSESDACYAPLSAAICPTVKGNPAVCENSIAWNFQGLKIYGKSIQNGLPSPKNPVPIISVGESEAITLSITDGADQLHSLAVSIPSGLFGIPVSSGGNYTDTRGQQWVCDMIDFEAKQIEHKIYRKHYDPTDINYVSGQPYNVYTYQNSDKNIINGDLIGVCSVAKSDVSYSENNTFRPVIAGMRGRFDAITSPKDIATVFPNGFDCLFIRKEEEFTPISNEELNIYRRLQTYDGTTVITVSDSMASIEATYVMDGNKYRESIEKRLTALAIVNGKIKNE